MQSIQANTYPIHFNEKGYEALNLHVKENKYSNLFIIVDSNTNEFCLPHFLPFLETELTIEIIEFENGEINKNIETCIQIWNVLTELGADSLIYRSVEIKNEIVIQDPTEKNIRKSLNFGHTLGHAIESYFLENKNKTTLLHGEAIAVGMILESYIALKMELINQDEYSQIKSSLKSIYDDIVFNENDIEPIMELLIHDKKNEYGNIQFALIEGIGKIKINQSVENELILNAFEDYKS